MMNLFKNIVFAEIKQVITGDVIYGDNTLNGYGLNRLWVCFCAKIFISNCPYHTLGTWVQFNSVQFNNSNSE